MAFQDKKFLDAEGITHLVRLLDEYPNNQVLGSVIDAIEGELEQKAEKSEIPNVPVQDVQVNGVSVLQDGVANVPTGSANEYGVVKPNYGLYVNASGQLNVQKASDSSVKSSAGDYAPITPSAQHRSTFYGLAKAAGHDEKNSAEPLGTYTPSAKAAIQKMLGVSDLIAPEENNLIASKAYAIGEVFTANGKLYKATAAIAQDAAIITDGASANCEETSVGEGFPHDVQVNGVSIVSDGKANVPPLAVGQYGAAKIGYSSESGLEIGSTGNLRISHASASNLKAGANAVQPITPDIQHNSTFYGLAKAAGADEKDSTLPVGQYTDTAKAAIKSMIGVNVEDVQIDSTSIITNGIADIPIANATNKLGVVKVHTDYGLNAYASGLIRIWGAGTAEIKNGTHQSKPIVPERQHEATFYGLAKASGDTTQSTSSNAVGTYTDNAKASIKAMLGIQDGSTGTVDVSGATPTIAAVENTRYVCGEVTSLNFTPPASGISIVRFTSGSSVTVLTIPSTVKFPEWFDPTSLETDTIYEICVTDGVYGAVMSWAL